MIKQLFTVFVALSLAACATTEDVFENTPLSDAPLHGKFVWHDLVTDDIDAAKAFYGSLFGWSFRDTQRPEGGPYTLVVGAGGRILGGMIEVEDPGNGVDYSRWLGYISVPDVDASAAAVTRLGGAMVVAPREVGSFARAAVARDAQGAVVGFLDSHVGDPQDPPTQHVGDVTWNELLAANDVSASAFYLEAAGYEVTTTWRNGGEYHTLNRGGVARAGIQDRPNDQVSPLWLTHFAVVDPASAASKAASLGGNVVMAPSAKVRDGNLAIITDPTGAVLALGPLDK
ncbi:VOC family protein [Marinihelvus fidelis]|uniref:VOC family protein n=1 Tax=Marinihelvus fidelis TaxID=2613842 RepID=A0A5N0TDA9_9GAMM|nr:VOC family protein [Marinihelvus fidelis]KAA9132678.1 VOC family protein [Marinihelvus fidelis]